MILRDPNGRSANLGNVSIASGYRNIQVPGNLENGTYKLLLIEKCSNSDDKSSIFPIQSETFTIEQSGFDPIGTIPNIEFEKPREKKEIKDQNDSSFAQDTTLDEENSSVIVSLQKSVFK